MLRNWDQGTGVPDPMTTKWLEWTSNRLQVTNPHPRHRSGWPAGVQNAGSKFTKYWGFIPVLPTSPFAHRDLRCVCWHVPAIHCVALQALCRLSKAKYCFLILFSFPGHRFWRGSDRGIPEHKVEWGERRGQWCCQIPLLSGHPGRPKVPTLARFWPTTAAFNYGLVMACGAPLCANNVLV